LLLATRLTARKLHIFLLDSFQDRSAFISLVRSRPMNSPRKHRNATEIIVLLRVEELESRDQPSVLGMADAVLGKLVDLVAPNTHALEHSSAKVTQDSDQNTASTAQLNDRPKISAALKALEKTVDRLSTQLESQAMSDKLPKESKNADSRTERSLATSNTESAALTIDAVQTHETMSISETSDLVISVKLAETEVFVKTPPAIEAIVTAGTETDRTVVLLTSRSRADDVVSEIESPTASPITPAVTAATPSVATSLTAPTSPVNVPTTASTATPAVVATAAAVFTAPINGVVTTPFVLLPKTPAIGAGGPTGGTGTVAPAAGAVPAGTVIAPSTATTPTANVIGANTGVVLIPPTEQPAGAGATGSPEPAVTKVSLPILGARLDGYLMTLVGAAYGFWHWKRRPKGIRSSPSTTTAA
jgi:hypothetical protein